MRLRAKNNLCLVAVATLLTLSACISGECLDNKNSLPLAGFYTSSTDPKAISLSGLTVYGYGAPGDSVLLQSGVGVNSLYLYQERHQFYAERPYHGIYEINAALYEKICDELN